MANEFLSLINDRRGNSLSTALTTASENMVMKISPIASI